MSYHVWYSDNSEWIWIEQDDFWEAVGDTDFDDELEHRLKDPDYAEMVMENISKLGYSRSWTNKWTKNIEEYLNKNCNNLSDILDVEKKLGI